MKYWIPVVLLFVGFNVFAEEKNGAPELWTWIKDVNKSKAACEIQSSYILKKLNLSNQVENDYGIYGNVKSNRVVVKCIAITDTSSKLLVAVAGNDRGSVELVRNIIVKSIN